MKRTALIGTTSFVISTGPMFSATKIPANPTKGPVDPEAGSATPEEPRNPIEPVTPLEIRPTYLDHTPLLASLTTKILGRRLVEWHDLIDSTNSRARQLALAGADEGTLILARSQTAGRGRLGRTWHSPPGLGLYLSLVLKPIPPEAPNLITLAAGLGSLRALTQLTGRRPYLKWPNDLLYDDRKVAGILAELDGGASEARFVILGLGLNLNHLAGDLPPDLVHRAGSLRLAFGHSWEPHQILPILLAELEQAYLDLAAGRRQQILEEYRQNCDTIGSVVRIGSGREVLTGPAVTVDDWGRLVLDVGPPQGLIPVAAGEVTLTGSPRNFSETDHS